MTDERSGCVNMVVGWVDGVVGVGGVVWGEVWARGRSGLEDVEMGAVRGSVDIKGSFWVGNPLFVRRRDVCR